MHPKATALEINLIIKELLARHDFVSLPGLGSFVQKYEPARLAPDGQSFLPPRQTVTFDTSRAFNDEAIENFLCEKTGVNHARAAELLVGFVNSVRAEIDNQAEVLFENVGLLGRGKDGEIYFKQAEPQLLASDTYGLGEIRVEPKVLAQEQQEVKPLSSIKGSVRPPYPKPGKPKTVRVLAVILIVLFIACAAGTFWLIPQFRFWQKKGTGKPAITASSPRTDKQVAGSVLADSSGIPGGIDTPKGIELEADKKKALYYEEPRPGNSKTHYLIAGSFSQLENARKLAELLAKKGYKPEIIESDNAYRVAILKFTNHDRALRELNRIRAEKPRESIWLLSK